MERFMRNSKQAKGRILAYDQVSMEANKAYVECDAKGAVQGEELEMSNEVLHKELLKSDEELKASKRAVLAEQAKTERSEKMAEELQIELAGIRPLFTEATDKVKALELEVSELKELAIKEAPKPKPKKKK